MAIITDQKSLIDSEHGLCIRRQLLIPMSVHFLAKHFVDQLDVPLVGIANGLTTMEAGSTVPHTRLPLAFSRGVVTSVEIGVGHKLEVMPGLTVTVGEL